MKNTAPVEAQAATSVASTSFSANWSASAWATEYRLDVATDSGFTGYVSGYQDLNVGNVLTAPVTGLSAGQTYYYRVRAQDGSGTSWNSQTITVSTIPAAPAAQAATAVASTSF